MEMKKKKKKERKRPSTRPSSSFHLPIIPTPSIMLGLVSGVTGKEGKEE